jgi:hypothetical protein
VLAPVPKLHDRQSGLCGFVLPAETGSVRRVRREKDRLRGDGGEEGITATGERGWGERGRMR